MTPVFRALGLAAAAALALAVVAFTAWSGSHSALWLVILCAGVVALLGSLLAAARLVRDLGSSLRDLSESARGLSPDRPGERLPEPRGMQDLHRLAGELNALLQRLESSAQSQAQFAGNVAHEFRTPVAALLAEVQVMKLGKQSRTELGQFLERTENELRRLGRLVDSFLILARIEAGDQRRDLIHIDDVVRRARKHCLEAAEQKSIRLELHCPETTAASDPFVIGDAELLQALVENLIRNAIRHSPKGERVSIRTTRGERAVQVVVSDHGPGLPADMREGIFESGARTRRLRTGKGGSGLGLSIADSVARMHAGRIRLVNGEAQGCTFVIELPAMPAPRLE